MVSIFSKFTIEIMSGLDVSEEVCKEALSRISTKKIDKCHPDRILFAKIKDVVVGFLLFQTSKNLNTAFLSYIEVTDEMKRKGVGTALMQTMIEKIKKLGTKKLCIELVTPDKELLQLSEEEIEANELQEQLAEEQRSHTANLFFSQFSLKSKIPVEEKETMVSRQNWRKLTFTIA